jgi:CubicO group peptidase (beta-lactamase class C family)
MLDRADPEAMGIEPGRWQTVIQLATRWCEEDCLPAIGLIVGRSDKTTGTHLFGRQELCDTLRPIVDDAIFLIASITKPIVATGVLLLVERGELSLGDRVTEFIPEFGENGKNGITLRHLLTHTSGLPDMLPNNRELRAAHAPLSSFVEGTCQSKTSFAPGRGVQYQSMGFAVLGEIISRVSGGTCAQFLHDELFVPLGMQATALGTPDAWYAGPKRMVDRIPEIRVPPYHENLTDWNWNSRYWRSLGAPWGGLLTTPSDLALFAQLMLNGGCVGQSRLLGKATVAAATGNQLSHMRDVPSIERRCRPWGLGWRLNWPAHSANFGDFLGPRTFGHWGSTGTVLWIDPDLDAFAVILTTQPQEPQGRYLSRLSNAIAASFR